MGFIVAEVTLVGSYVTERDACQGRRACRVRPVRAAVSDTSGASCGLTMESKAQTGCTVYRAALFPRAPDGGYKLSENRWVRERCTLDCAPCTVDWAPGAPGGVVGPRASHPGSACHVSPSAGSLDGRRATARRAHPRQRAHPYWALSLAPSDDLAPRVRCVLEATSSVRTWCSWRRSGVWSRVRRTMTRAIAR